ncbi:mevalonate kinase [Flavobacteriaceae bacterium]|jgi:mevalonate kinase|nr:mevalonate kinase [Flavobacteriaceae bacterium]MBT4297871.1 mevalonate kinase [Flavobacteriaceae bacterium]MBT6654705.1 mevalonate kinase [Flavobacteriaceae bacterium]MBT7574191.1 mevalonate kinase [Flavobacteriaceae bacterium]MDA7566720.1 mevalonate kinase [Flavobacteriaceae bacterium]|tara:strand:- start:266 stop:1195 length:930 start_codon:yes stop_codon:yes gene_type:complete
MKAPLFYSKILLFGEYGIIKNSKGLSIPYNFFKGGLKIGNFKNESEKASNKSLTDFKNYLKTIESSVVEFDFIKLDTDLKNGMFFDSTIPQGYGVGSSGALVAALYDRYALNKITVLENLTKPKILILKNIFSKMESFFHGKSSGLDPLNSYLSLPILIHSKNEIETTGIPSQSSNGKGAVFLLDSGMSSETAPMVDLFFKSMKNKNYNKIIKENFIKTTDDCVEDFLNGNFNSLFTNMKILSKVVLENFKPMIPKDFHQLWKKGIESDDYFLKLCGSGGGGYILGFSKDFQKAKESLSNYKLEVVYNF